MKKEYALIVVFVAVMLVAACMPTARLYACQDGSQVSDPALCRPGTAPERVNSEPVAQPEEKPAAVPSDAVNTISEETMELLDKSKKAAGVSFSYFSSDNPNIENIYYASRDKMKIELKTKMKYSSGETYDTVYLDLVNKKALGYCERLTLETCKDRNKAYDVSYDVYVIETPFDWLTKISNVEVTGKSKMIDGRTVKEVNFQLGKEKGIMFLDSFFGVPVEINYQGTKIGFTNMVINEVTEAKLTHQTYSNTV